VQEKPRALSP